MVCWKGFTAESDTWEGRENLENVKEVIKEFEKEYQRDIEDVVMPDSHLGNKSDIFYHNNENNQLKRRVWPPRDVH